jgi:hypothetical protein
MQVVHAATDRAIVVSQKQPVPIARPDTIRKALECEESKRFYARGATGVKGYGSPCEFEEVRNRCVEKLKLLAGGAGE